MDGFTLYFDSLLTETDICRTLQTAGFSAVIQGPHRLAVSSGDAYIWITIDDLEDLKGPDFENAQDIPMPVNEIQTLVTVMVRRNSPSGQLAVIVADNLVRMHRAKITWDGMDYWEDLYRKYTSGR